MDAQSEVSFDNANDNLAQQNRQLQDAVARHEADLRSAQMLFDGFLRLKQQPWEHCSYHIHGPHSICSDFVLSGALPNGERRFLIGDFNNHRLPTAIGTLIVREVFFAMIDKKLPSEIILREINYKLRRILGMEQVLSACLIAHSPNDGTTKIWNRGLPEVLLFDENGHCQSRFPSTAARLGILPDHKLDIRSSRVQMKRGDSLLVFSDGLISAIDAESSLYSDIHKLDTEFNSTQENIFICLWQTFLDACPEPSDDATLFQLRFQGSSRKEPRLPEVPEESGELSWTLNSRLCAHALSAKTPLDGYLDALSRFDGFKKSHKNYISLIITELFNNALDHGILAMDSSLKTTKQGFYQYYDERRTRLNRLESGVIVLELEYWRSPPEHAVIIRVGHDGISFDHKLVHSALENNQSAYDRGVALVRALCKELDYVDDGKLAVARYRWNDYIDEEELETTEIQQDL